MPSLLPPNTTALEAAIAAVAAERLAAIEIERIATLWSIAACPDAFLPVLAWQISVDEWDPKWDTDRQRAVIAASLDVHRHKGSLGSVRRVLAAAGYESVTITEGGATWCYGDGTRYGDVVMVYGASNNWARYTVQIDRPITSEQAASITRLLNATAPARCVLDLVRFSTAPWVYGDGSKFGDPGLKYYAIEAL